MTRTERAEHWPRAAQILPCIIASVLVAGSASGQEPRPDSAQQPRELPQIFRSDSFIEFTLTANFRALGRQRTGTSPYHRAKLTYRDSAAQAVEIPLRVRARGHWRRAQCAMPPLLLNFWNDSAKKTLFARADRGRLVMHCQDSDIYDQYVIQEYQLYRAYNLLTPLSHRARLARVTYVDSATARPVTTRYAFFLEDDAAMAARNSGRILETKGAKAGDMDPFGDALVGVFQYLIANTDWSVGGLHNVLLVMQEGVVHEVAYDFDWSGAVNTRYSRPDYRLPIQSTTQRLYRGLCVEPEYFQRAFALLTEQKPAIYALYGDHIGKLLRPDIVTRTLRYFDDFYEVIGDARYARREIISSCLQSQ